MPLWSGIITTMAELYVGVVIHGCPELVTPCLDSLFNSELDFTTRFLLLDNGSPNPNEVAQVFQTVNEKYSHLAETHVSQENKGCAGGWNFCIQRALSDPECKWVILAGHDIVVHKRTLSNLVHRFLRGGVDLTSGVDALYDQPMPEPVEQEVPGANFSLIMLPRKLIEDVGLFDDNFWPAYYEDNDYHFRCILGGHGRGIWTWLAPFRHSRSSTIRTYPQLMQHAAKNASYFMSKWGGMPGEVLEKNAALKKACEEAEQRRKLESGEGWKKNE
ncbi:MAG: glycosyltransferase [Nitrososphaera sp.]|nr:glycosyltransferase [Nitrososphaera sp.]